MREYIHKLRSKPEDARKRILAGSLVVSMAFVGVVWIYSLGYRLHTEVTPEATATAVKPFSVFAESVSSAYQNISASVGSISYKTDTTNQQPARKQINLIPVEPTQ
jgi:hypothetical protein